MFVTFSILATEEWRN